MQMNKGRWLLLVWLLVLLARARSQTTAYSTTANSTVEPTENTSSTAWFPSNFTSDRPVPTDNLTRKGPQSTLSPSQSSGSTGLISLLSFSSSGSSSNKKSTSIPDFQITNFTKSTYAGLGDGQSTTDSNEKKSSLWTVPFIVLLVVSATLIVVCIVCLIFICRLKKLLRKRSKLYPGAVGLPEDDEHTYMDLGDHPRTAPPPVELKSITNAQEGEIKLPEKSENAKGIKSYKDRKMKPAPPLPDVPKPPARRRGSGTVKDDKVNAKEIKRNQSLKKKPPSYNNSVPLDLTDDDENDLYESYDHSHTIDEYTGEMIEEALESTKEEIQRHKSFERETSNKLRNAQGSFIVSDDAHREGLAFTERQISNSGLPEIVVEYNANKEIEGLLNLQGTNAYDNKVFEMIDEDFGPSGHNENSISVSRSNYNENISINKGERNNEDEEKMDQAESIQLYDDEFVPVSKPPESSDIDALPLYDDAEENSTPDVPFYDDNFVPSPTTEQDTVDNLPVYDLSFEINGADKLENNKIANLPVYEDADEPTENNLSTDPDKASKENVRDASVNTGHVSNISEIKRDIEPISIDDLGDYEDYEVSKLPPAPPPPVHSDLNQEHDRSDSTHVAETPIKAAETKNYNKSTSEKVVDTQLPPAPPERHDLYGLDIESDRTTELSALALKANRSDTDPVSKAVRTLKKTPPTPNNSPEQWNFAIEKITDGLSHNINAPKLLDLSLEPEMKFRSGSKVDIFDEPGLPNSPDTYFLDMTDAPSVIVDTSPIIDVEKPVVSTRDNEPVRTDKLTVTSNFDTAASGTFSDDFYENTVFSSKKSKNTNQIANEKNPSANNVESTVPVLQNLLNFDGDKMPTVRQTDFDTTFREKEKNNSLSVLEQNGSFDEDGDLYDVPPPNFPPPELKLN